MLTLGFTLGFFITLASSGFLALFGDYPCLITFALIIQSMYSFFVYMKVYEESNFTDSNYLFFMIFAFISFGEAINLNICGAEDDHGFNQANRSFALTPASFFSRDSFGFLPQFEQTSYFISLFTLFA